MIEEVGQMVWVFAHFQEYPFKEVAKEQGWTLDHISKIQEKVQHFVDMAEQIKQELIGDGDEAKFVGRLRTAFFELNGNSSFAPSYFPEFDEACFKLPTKDYPERNKELLDAIAAVYGDDALPIIVRLGSICRTANYIVQDVCSKLDEVCRFVGYTPEPQQGKQQKPKQVEQEHQGCQQQHPQNGEVFLPDVLNTQKTKAVFDEAITRGWMQLNGTGGYEWLGLKDYERGKQQQFVYMIGQMYGYKKSDSGNEGNNIPCKPLEKLFGISGIYSLLIKCWQVSKPQPWREAIDDMIATALQKTTASTSN